MKRYILLPTLYLTLILATINPSTTMAVKKLAQNQVNTISMIENLASENFETEIADRWYSVSFNNKKIGFSNQKISQGKSGYRVEGRSVFRITAGASKVDISFFRTFFLDKNRKVFGFITVEQSNGQVKKSTGVIDNDSNLKMVVKGSASQKEYNIKLPADVKFLDLFGFQNGAIIKPNTTYKFATFLPSFRTVKDITFETGSYSSVAVNNQSYEAYPIKVSFDNMLVNMSVSKDGVLLKESHEGLGFQSELSTEKDALKLASEGISASSFLTFSLIKTEKKILNSQHLTHLSLLVSGLSHPKMIPSDRRQSKSTPIWSTIEKKKVLTIPLDIKLVKPSASHQSSKEKTVDKRWLQPTYEIQSDSEIIIKLAKDIIKDEKDQFKRALLINNWVYRYLKKRLVDSFSALDALKAKEGECQAHTYLFSALARSVGIPTKVVSGIVYSEEAEGFLYHAWPEIFVGEWIALDPTLGESIANPTHIKLTEGDLNSQLKIAGYIGKIKIKIQKLQYR
ncbi:MAG: transglutaminase-like domain-containing protein [Nitrospinota bacterium]